MKLLLNNEKQLSDLFLNVDSKDIQAFIQHMECKETPLVLDSGPTGSALINLNTSGFIYLSPRLKNMLGLSQIDVGENYLNLLQKILPIEDTSFFEKTLKEFSLKLINVSPFDLNRWFCMGEFRTYAQASNEEKWYRYRVIILKNGFLRLLFLVTDISLLKNDKTLSWYVYNTYNNEMIEKKTKQAISLNIKETKNTEQLTNRELEIVKLISDGYSNKQISAKLFVSNNTIKTHRQHIYEKLRVNKSSEMIKVCLSKGII